MTIRQFAKISEVNEGAIVVADSGFTCIKSGARLLVQKDENGEPYVPCNEGRHYLDGQIGIHEHDRNQYVGFFHERVAANRDGTEEA